jgi:maltooligosyltrehalose trehalohydrolase
MGARITTPEMGATCLPDARVRFRVWGPRCKAVAVQVVGPTSRGPEEMAPSAGGWFEITLEGLGPGARYVYVLDGERERPDPASRALPEGVHGPSEVVDTAAFPWTDASWRGLALGDMVIYELHVGTFVPAGTFDGMIPRLERLRDLGVNTLELMPVASFPGARNWGYDGVGLFAPQRTYGGPAGLSRLVDACHASGLAVMLDVVYNHLGCEGNYLAEFGPYFTDRYRTPWGPAVNYDGEDARGVREFIIANALYWIREYHIDGLRLDAVHGIFDASPAHILCELNQAVQRLARRLGRHVPVVAESDLNDRRVIAPLRRGGYGLAGQWSDDFHHCLHALLTGERHGYYVDFGSVMHLAKAYTDGFVYDGQHSVFRGGRHGTPTRDIPGERFVVFDQNHDQVGNRARGERLSGLVSLEALKLAATAALLSPSVPLLFMGEEYGEQAPFLFFTDFGDPALRAAVVRGRRKEFTAFGWMGEVPDPQDPGTFQRSRLDWNLQAREPHCRLREYYRALLSLRRSFPVLGAGGKRRLEVKALDERTLSILRRRQDGTSALLLLHFTREGGTIRLKIPAGCWRRLLDSAEDRFGGQGTKCPPLLWRPAAAPVAVEMMGYQAVVYLKEGGHCNGTNAARPRSR